MVSSGRSVAYITDSRDTAHPSHGIPYLIKDRNSFKQACAWFRWAMLALPYQQQQRKADVTVTSYDFTFQMKRPACWVLFQGVKDLDDYVQEDPRQRTAKRCGRHVTDLNRATSWYRML